MNQNKVVRVTGGPPLQARLKFGQRPIWGVYHLKKLLSRAQTLTSVRDFTLF